MAQVVVVRPDESFERGLGNGNLAQRRGGNFAYLL